MREVVIDTETTGLDWRGGDRLVEIAAIELVNFIPTGRRYHRYLNPERDIPVAVYNIHGLTSEFLQRFPVFWMIADEFLSFIAGAKLVIHNAQFDLGFINAELTRINRQPLAVEFVDTLALARRQFPGAPASLDALARRFKLPAIEQRQMHGADIDCALLADVYIELSGGKSPSLDIVTSHNPKPFTEPERAYRAPRPHAPSAAELVAHAAMLAQTGEWAIKNPLWLQCFVSGEVCQVCPPQSRCKEFCEVGHQTINGKWPLCDEHYIPF